MEPQCGTLCERFNYQIGNADTEAWKHEPRIDGDGIFIRHKHQLIKFFDLVFKLHDQLSADLGEIVEKVLVAKAIPNQFTARNIIHVIRWMITGYLLIEPIQRFAGPIEAP
jgi:hypothetical protein